MNKVVAVRPDWLKLGSALLLALGLLSFVLGWSEADVESPPPEEFVAGVPLLVPGQVQTGRLELSDNFAEGGYFDIWAYTPETGEDLEIRATSDEIDTKLQLLIDYEILATDDDSGDGLNPLIRYTIERPGEYLVVVSGYDAEQLGTYMIELRRITR